MSTRCLPEEALTLVRGAVLGLARLSHNRDAFTFTARQDRVTVAIRTGGDGLDHVRPLAGCVRDAIEGRVIAAPGLGPITCRFQSSEEWVERPVKCGRLVFQIVDA